MKRIIIFAAIGFLVAIGVGIGVSVILGPPSAAETPEQAAAAPNKVAPASAGQPGEHVSSDPGGSHGTTGETTDGHAAGEGFDARQASAVPIGSSSQVLPANAATASHQANPEFPAMARVLMTMTPQEAIRFLGHLTDDEILGIVRTMRIRDAAAVLTLLPSERAASIKARIFEFVEEKQ